MEMCIDKKELQSVLCIKDHNLYVYKIDENPCFIEDDYALIKCFPMGENGFPDFSKVIEIYGKDLLSVA